jgi:hypothetical protein
MYVLEVRGSGRERGRVHGEALRDLVHEHLERWRQALLDDVVVDPDTYVTEFLADTDFEPTARRWTPDLLDEARGLCEAAGTDWRYTFTRLLSDEEPWYRRARKLGAWPGRSRLPSRRPEDDPLVVGARGKGCSSVGRNAAAGLPALIAQNMDMPTWCDGHQLLLRVADPATGVEAMVFTLPGKISLCGMNNRGLGIACNSLLQLDYDPAGLAEDFVVRGYLAQESVEAGLEFLRRVPHASGQNYTVSGQGGEVLNLECSKGGVVSWRPWPGADCVYHTNHPLASRDDAIYRELVMPLAKEQRDRVCSWTTADRLAELGRWFGDPQVPVTVERAKAAFSSRVGPVCRHGEHEGRKDIYTLGCIVMSFGDPPALEVAPGPPDVTPFQVFRF